MEVENAGAGPSRGAQSQVGLEYRLHPLVLINISDHHNRYRVQGERPVGDVVGCLLGTQEGRVLEISNSFEAACSGGSAGAPELDEGFLVMRQEQYKKVYPDLELVGYYSLGTKPTDGHHRVHAVLAGLTDNPVLLLLDTNVEAGAQAVPARLFEPLLHIGEGGARVELSETQFTLHAEEAERIAVEQAARLLPAAGEHPSLQVASHAQQLQPAVAMMRTQVEKILQYLKDARDGRAPVDHAVLREVNALLSRPPPGDVPGFAEADKQDRVDVLMTELLAGLAEQAGGINSLSDKISLAYDRVGRGRGGML
ncbi:unnamed protein product [Pedinophyceae sp. YPF-701]|nr:unnamed protein product [Pedinophyceae sp. YPF-701]